MTDKTILVTGAAGYIATNFLKALRRKLPEVHIVGLDLNAPKVALEDVTYLRGDMTTHAWQQSIIETKPDVVVHLAFILNPMRDERRMHKINVQGTRNTFKAAKVAGAKHIVVTSSATVYGAKPDNPVPLTEEHPWDDNQVFQYAQDKAELENYYRDFRTENPDIRVGIVRPTAVFGPNVDNYLSRFLFAFPFLPVVMGSQPRMQIVHEDDVSNFLVCMVEQGAGGIYNVAPDDALDMDEIAELSNRRVVALPRILLEKSMRVLWKLGVKRVELPETFLDFATYPWLLSNAKAARELGFRPQYSSRETLKIMLAHRK